MQQTVLDRCPGCSCLPVCHVDRLLAKHVAAMLPELGWPCTHTTVCRGCSLGSVGGMPLVTLCDQELQRPWNTHKIAAAQLQAASSTFLLVLDVHKWLAMPSAAPRPRRVTGQATEPGKPGMDAPGSPPYALMDHQPLALLVNGLLAAFNELRHCAPLSLRDPVAEIVQA